MRISSMLAATMVAGAPDAGVPAAPPPPEAERRPQPRRTRPRPVPVHGERRSRRPAYTQLRHRLLQR